MKGNLGKKYNLRHTPKTGLTIYGVMGRINTNPKNKVRARKNHGITTHITRESEERKYEYKH